MKIFFLLFFVAINAQAFDYYSVQIGRAKLEHKHSDGWWYQDHYGAQWDEDSPAWSLRGGININKNIAAEIGYTDLGKFSVYGYAVSDQDFENKNWSGAGTSFYGTARTYGFDFSLKYKLNFENFHPYIRGGFYAYHSQFQFWTLTDSGIFASGTNPFPDKRNQIKTFGGIGIEYKNIFFEYTRYSYIATEWSAIQSGKMFSIGVEF